MNRSLLDGISIASPCSADWNQMTGDDRRRFCAQCKLHVHDLSGMTADAAMALLRQTGKGRVCVRFFRRTDGTVLTRDCPVGLRQKLRRAWARAGALWLALWGSAACARPAATPTPGPEVLRPLQGEAVMGDVAAPEPKAQLPRPGHEHMGIAAPPPVETPKK
ncbi:MAG: hypothetical protein WBO45_17140 [Planctomycetota bacterium]